MKVLLLLLILFSCALPSLKNRRHISSNYFNKTCFLKDYSQEELDEINEEIILELGKDDYQLIKTDQSDKNFLSYGLDKISHNIIQKNTAQNIFGINVGNLFFFNFDKNLENKLGDTLWDKICGNFISIPELNKTSLLKKELSPLIITTLVQMQQHDFKYKHSFVFGDTDSILSLSALKLGANKVYSFKTGKKEDLQKNNHLAINSFEDNQITYINPENKEEIRRTIIRYNKNIVVVSHNGANHLTDKKGTFLTNEYPISLADYFPNITEYIFGGYRPLPRFDLTHLIYDKRLNSEKKFKHNPLISRFKTKENSLAYSWSSFKSNEKKRTYFFDKDLKEKNTYDFRTPKLGFLDQIEEIESESVTTDWFNVNYYGPFLKKLKKNKEFKENPKKNNKSAITTLFDKFFYQPFLKLIGKNTEQQKFEHSLNQTLELKKNIKPYFKSKFKISNNQDPENSPDPVKLVKVSPNEKWIAYLSWIDPSIKIWDIQSKKLLNELKLNDKQKVQSISWDPSGKYLATLSHNQITIWNVKSGESKTFAPFQSIPKYISWSPTGKYIASISNSIRIWDVETSHSKKLPGKVKSISWEPAGKYLAAGSDNNTISIWDIKSNRVINILEANDDEPGPISWDPTGKYIASTSYSNTLRIWDIKSGKSLNTKKGHRNTIKSISWDPTGEYLATGSSDYTIKIWKTKSGKLIKTLKGSENSIMEDFFMSVSWSSHGKYITSGSWSGFMQIWEVTYK